MAKKRSIVIDHGSIIGDAHNGLAACHAIKRIVHKVEVEIDRDTCLGAKAAVAALLPEVPKRHQLDNAQNKMVYVVGHQTTGADELCHVVAWHYDDRIFGTAWIVLNEDDERFSGVYDV